MAYAKTPAMPRRVRSAATLFAFTIALCVSVSSSFYLPGIAPKDYSAGEELDVMASKLTSPKNQLPYDYFSLPFCGSDDKSSHRSKPVNLGQLLMGERMKPTDYKLNMRVPTQCSVLCSVKLNKYQVKLFERRINQEYSVRLNLDNMPVVMEARTVSGQKAYHFGYRVGVKRGNKYYINNHLKFLVRYNEPSQSSDMTALELDTTQDVGFRVVGFEVEPYSVGHGSAGALGSVNGTCPVTQDTAPQEIQPDEPITFTYDVDFVVSGTRWATRWDALLAPNPELKQIQWFSVVNSLMITLFLTTLVGTVLLRTVLRDFVRYNQLEDEDEADDVTGWKLVHGDVFRAPPRLALLSICIGSGSQTLVMSSITLAFALLGFLSPANRGGLLTAMLSLWVLASSINGYSTARFYSSYDNTGANRKMVTLGSAFLFPGASFSLFFLLNLSVWASGSSGAVPFITLVLLLFMWFGVSVPLVFTGAYIGYKRKPVDFPVRTNQIPRQVPPSPLGIPPAAYMLLAGVLPFGTVFMELVLLLNAVAQSQVLYVFGMLSIVFVILLVTCAEVSVVFTYLALSNEQWAWNWHAFLTSASSGLYMFLYTQYYLFTQPSFGTVTFVSIALFSTYSLIMSAAFALLTGSVGHYASSWFVRKIYSNIHVS